MPTSIFSGPNGKIMAPGASAYSPIYGGIPSLPDPAQTYKAAIDANAAMLPDLYNMAGGINAFNLGQVTNQYTAGIPNYYGKIAQSGANIDAMLAGQVPIDVQNVLGQAAAERGVRLGTPTSGFSNYDYLRSLGLTSRDQQLQGEKLLTEAIARMPRTGLYDFTQAFVPGQVMQDTAASQAIYNAAPVPAYNMENALNAARRGMDQGYNSNRPNITQTPNAERQGSTVTNTPGITITTTPNTVQQGGRGQTTTTYPPTPYSYNATPIDPLSSGAHDMGWSPQGSFLGPDLMDYGAEYNENFNYGFNPNSAFLNPTPTAPEYWNMPWDTPMDSNPMLSPNPVYANPPAVDDSWMYDYNNADLIPTGGYEWDYYMPDINF